MAEHPSESRRIGSGSRFEAAAGYSRAVVEAGWVFVSGTTGFDYARMTIEDDLAAQAQQCFRNIEAALAEAGARLDDVVRVRYYVTEDGTWEVLAPIMKQHLGRAAPAATLLICGLLDRRMKIEIEVTAKLPAAG